MEDAQIVLERHEQRIKAIERDISDLKAVQTEIRTMNERSLLLPPSLNTQMNIWRVTSRKSMRLRISPE